MRTAPLRIKRLGLGLGLAAVLAAGSALPALAADPEPVDQVVTQTINGGDLTVAVDTAPTFDAVAYSHDEQVKGSTDDLEVTVNDSTGSGSGWNLTLVSSDFVLGGGSTGHDITADKLSVSPEAPEVVDGQAIDTGAGKGPAAGTGPLALDEAQQVLGAGADFGMGEYSQALPLTLTIPEQARAGTYTATLTLTLASGPGA
jgi:hypothetical protein